MAVILNRQTNRKKKETATLVLLSWSSVPFLAVGTKRREGPAALHGNLAPRREGEEARGLARSVVRARAQGAPSRFCRDAPARALSCRDRGHVCEGSLTGPVRLRAGCWQNFSCDRRRWASAEESPAR